MHSFQVMHLFDASGGKETKGGGGKNGMGERGGGEETKRGKGRERDQRKKYIETDRKPCRNGRDKSLITMYYWCVAMCRNRVFINTVDTKHSFILKHFEFADIINIALSVTKTGTKRGDHVLCNKSFQ